MKARQIIEAESAKRFLTHGIKTAAKIWAVTVRDTTPGWGQEGSFYVRSVRQPTADDISALEDEWMHALDVSPNDTDDFWKSSVRVVSITAVPAEVAATIDQRYLRDLEEEEAHERELRQRYASAQPPDDE